MQEPFNDVTLAEALNFLYAARDGQFDGKDDAYWTEVIGRVLYAGAAARDRKRVK